MSRGVVHGIVLRGLHKYRLFECLYRSGMQMCLLLCSVLCYV
jgi:hypothetical protein